mmetsp:Transcript_30750/g.22844  ORF Transcript_30750/g.22844 Transcript_30750/m.22844 type:complete len:142 (+) Transcript_30750:384-809(+)
MQNLTMNIKANPGIQEGKFQLEFDYLQLDIDVFNLTLEGGDMASMMNYFSDWIIKVIRESLIGVLQEQTVASIEEIINNHIYKQVPDADFPNYGVELDMSLVGKGVVVTDEWLAIPLDGTFFPELYPEDDSKNYVKMPLYR